jgi:hypothetical protein
MANLTLAIDDDILRAARIKAVQQGTSVNDICRDAITRFAAPAVDHDDLLAQLRALAARNHVSRPAGNAAEPLPSRNAWMDEAMAERMPTLMAALAPK